MMLPSPRHTQYADCLIDSWSLTRTYLYCDDGETEAQRKDINFRTLAGLSLLERTLKRKCQRCNGNSEQHREERESEGTFRVVHTGSGCACGDGGLDLPVCHQPLQNGERRRPVGSVLKT